MDDPTNLTDAELRQREATDFSAAVNAFFRMLPPADDPLVPEAPTQEQDSRDKTEHS